MSQCQAPRQGKAASLRAVISFMAPGVQAPTYCADQAPLWLSSEDQRLSACIWMLPGEWFTVRASWVSVVGPLSGADRFRTN